MGKTNAKAKGGKKAAAPAKKSASIKGFFKPVSKSAPQHNKSPKARKKTNSSRRLSPQKHSSRPLSPQKLVVPEGKSEVTKPCPEIGEGWTQKVVLRKSGNKTSDRYYFSPDGSKFRSMAEVNRFLSAEGDAKPSKVPPKKRAASPRKDLHIGGKKVKEDLDTKKKAVKNKPKKSRTFDLKPAKKIKRNGGGDKNVLTGSDDEGGNESESTCEDPAARKSNDENNFSSSRRAAKKKINYNMDLEDSDEEEFAVSKVSAKKNPRGSGKRTATKVKSKKKRSKDDDDSDAFEPDNSSDGDESLSADSLDDESDDDFTEESVGEAPKKRKSTGKRTSGGDSKKVPAKKEPRKKKGDESFGDLVKKAADRFTPTNNPQIFPEKEFVSPVGIDATDGIVVGIIRGQVRKVGKLLQSQSLRKDSERELGELPSLVKLNTACSGTDAPSIGKLAKVRTPALHVFLILS